ncbi:hypothetical protein AB0D38_29815 [Streptomyces sp. NPDC048279]|uniref:hypothetical protein n=1 Tax=Streptomyces sp. NPDC048279 TaxID=3154714 RepID=UPI00344A0498
MALAEAVGAFVAAGTAEEGSPAGPAFQGRPQVASFHQPFSFHALSAALFAAATDRCPPPPGQSVHATAADGMPTVPTATAAMTIRR